MGAIRTPAERSLDQQNDLIALLHSAADLMVKQNRSVSASAGALRRLIVAEQKRRDMIRKDLDRQRARSV